MLILLGARSDMGPTLRLVSQTGLPGDPLDPILSGTEAQPRPRARFWEHPVLAHQPEVHESCSSCTKHLSGRGTCVLRATSGQS